jgi:hypothetical protein
MKRVSGRHGRRCRSRHAGRPNLPADGELNLKYPGGLDELMQRPASEGHAIVQRGPRHFVEDFENKLTGT